MNSTTNHGESSGKVDGERKCYDKDQEGTNRVESQRNINHFSERRRDDDMMALDNYGDNTTDASAQAHEDGNIVNEDVWSPTGSNSNSESCSLAFVDTETSRYYRGSTSGSDVLTDGNGDPELFGLPRVAPPSYTESSSTSTYTESSSTSTILNDTSTGMIQNGVNEIYTPSVTSPLYSPSHSPNNRAVAGLCGLQNLGNTCYMNSGLQCLNAVPQLVKYFTSGEYEADINKTNPLGTGGALAKEYADVVKNSWNGTNPTQSPHSFKNALSQFAPMLSGYSQHDSQEFLAFLLDALHEDLNKVLNKPYVEKVEGVVGMDEEKLANEAWEGHLKRNNSRIMDLCQGQLKSTVRCLACNRQTITFDPFMYLTLPISQEDRHIQFTFVPSAVAGNDVGIGEMMFRLMRYGLEIKPTTTFKEFKHLVRKLVGLTSGHTTSNEDNRDCAEEEEDDLLVCEVHNSTVFKYYANEKIVDSEVLANEDIVVFHVPLLASPPGYSSKKLNISQNEGKSADARGSGAKEGDDDLRTQCTGETPINPSENSEDISNPNDSGMDSDMEIASEKNSNANGLVTPAPSLADSFPVRGGCCYCSKSFDKLHFHRVCQKGLCSSCVEDHFNNSIEKTCFSTGCEEEITAMDLELVEANSFNTPKSLTPATNTIRSTSEPFSSSIGASGSFCTALNTYYDRKHEYSCLYSGKKPRVIVVYQMYNSSTIGQPLMASVPNDNTLTGNVLYDIVNRLLYSRLVQQNERILHSGLKYELIECEMKGEKYESNRRYVHRNEDPFDLNDPHLMIIWDKETTSMDALDAVNKVTEWHVSTQKKPTENVDIHRLLKDFTTCENLSENDMFYCSKCKKHQRASIHVSLWRLPDVLVVHLKRFHYDERRRCKIDTLIDFPIEGLDLHAYVAQHGERMDQSLDADDLAVALDASTGVGEGKGKVDAYLDTNTQTQALSQNSTTAHTYKRVGVLGGSSNAEAVPRTIMNTHDDSDAAVVDAAVRIGKSVNMGRPRRHSSAGEITSPDIEVDTGLGEVYDLVAVDNHMGSLSFGHYTAYIKHPNTQDWHNCNDQTVAPVRNPSEVVSPNAYVLFYMRREATNETVGASTFPDFPESHRNMSLENLLDPIKA
eukprot:CFRG8353T1